MNLHAGLHHLSLPSYSLPVRASWVVFWSTKSQGSLSIWGLSILPGMMARGLCVFIKAYRAAHQQARILRQSIASFQKSKLDYKICSQIRVKKLAFPSDYIPHSTWSSNPSFPLPHSAPTPCPPLLTKSGICLPLWLRTDYSLNWEQLTNTLISRRKTNLLQSSDHLPDWELPLISHYILSVLILLHFAFSSYFF